MNLWCVVLFVQLLMQLGVGRLVLPAVPSTLKTWTDSFGFAKMTVSERSKFLDNTFLNFEGSIMCHKLLITIPPPYSGFLIPNFESTSSSQFNLLFLFFSNCTKRINFDISFCRVTFQMSCFTSIYRWPQSVYFSIRRRDDISANGEVSLPSFFFNNIIKSVPVHI